MLRVKTRLAPSPIHGIGLFAVNKILKGTLVWEWDKDLDIKIRDDWSKENHESFFETYGWRDGFWRFVCFDNARFINHSSNPNLDGPPDESYAIRDIEAGEELTEDYSYDDDFPSYKDTLH